MKSKKTFILLCGFAVIATLMLLFVFYAFTNNTAQLKYNLNRATSSLNNVTHMQSLLDDQEILTYQLLSDDTVSITAEETFDACSQGFQRLCNEEKRDINEMEQELDYIDKILSSYNSFANYVGLFLASTSSTDTSDSSGRVNFNIYEIETQISDVALNLENYSIYIKEKLASSENDLIRLSKRTILIYAALSTLLILLVFIITKNFFDRKLTPLYSILEEHERFGKIKSDFFSTVSHEFKTPLTSIIMGADLLENSSNGELNETQRELIESIKEDSLLLTNLVNNLLWLSRADSSDVIYDFEDIDIEELISQSMSHFTGLANKRAIDFSFRPVGTIPSVYADAGKIIWVINNLLSNAFKYSNESSKVIISAYMSSDKFVSISVSDQGPGIPTMYREQIFERYFQVNNSDIELGGTGLGLPLSKDIVLAHNGKIWCTDNIPVGSVFTFTLPIADSL